MLIGVLWRKIKFLLQRNRMDRELDQEMAFHLERLAERNMKDGLDPDDARLAALRDFGGIDHAKEECLDARGMQPLAALAQDARYAIRTMTKKPAVSVLAIVVLALGIGANTAIFSIVAPVLLKSLPFKDSGRLVLLWHVYPKTNFPGFSEVSPPSFVIYRDNARAFDWVSAMEPARGVNLTGDGDPEQVQIEQISADMIGHLGVQPVLGRSFLPEEDKPGQERVVLISNALWRSRFGSDKDILGKQIAVNGVGFTVVGVMPPNFRILTRADNW
ncbi:MAG: ABC transporter permease, partial [Blastocatellia bacterium]